ncbi:MAG: tyrosine--tRNA ligase [Desulfobacterales bacterium]|nr:tyrosine--tRNA ligase [Desulfobacterales bacterium]
MNVIDILKERGFVEDLTHEEELKERASKESLTCYIGFDPTASSLHVGSLVQIMSLAHMQRNGHRPIALVGGGTGLVGDPSGKTELRKMLTAEKVNENAAGIKRQLSRFINFSENKAMMLNNADWLTKLGYIEFLRDIGRHFSVNRMVKAESYKMRLESDEGLNFIEFNYMLLQAYDFFELYNSHGCILQLGGSDQWGNIVAGVDLIRRKLQKSAYGVTSPLITTSGGAKMGKTAKGAVWLDADRTSPYEYYQYWVNTDDRDVARFLALFTFLPMDEIRAVEKLKDVEINAAKAVLAFETTRLAHGQEEALKARRAAANMFGQRAVPKRILPSSRIPREDAGKDDVAAPHTVLPIEELQQGVPAFKLFHAVGLASSGGAARRLIQQGGAYLNGERVEAFDRMVTDKDLDEKKTILLRSGKKRFHKVRIAS